MNLPKQRESFYNQYEIQDQEEYQQWFSKKTKITRLWGVEEK
jgi:hypothetical protein